MAIKFGLALPYLGARDVAHLAREAEESGWDGCFLGDAIWCEDPLIGLAAAAMITSRIRLGTMIIPAPLRRPWKIASEAVALDRLCDGRLILGLGAGAVWMGWQGFPDEVTDLKTRVEMLAETIDILTLLFQQKRVDYEGNHFHLKLSLVDEIYYPPRPVQQPRIPLWIPGIWPHEKSMERVLKCDGLLVEKRGVDGQPAEATPADVRVIKAYIDANRTLTTPFDIVVSGKTGNLSPAQQADQMGAWAEAGVTWWVEAFWEEPVEAAAAQISQGPPRLT